MKLTRIWNQAKATASQKKSNENKNHLKKLEETIEAYEVTLLGFETFLHTYFC